MTHAQSARMTPGERSIWAAVFAHYATSGSTSALKVAVRAATHSISRLRSLDLEGLSEEERRAVEEMRGEAR